MSLFFLNMDEEFKRKSHEFAQQDHPIPVITMQKHCHRCLLFNSSSSKFSIKNI